MFNTANFSVFGINSNETFIPQISTFLSRLEEKFNFFNPFGFEAESELNHKASKLMWNLTRASKTYLNNKSLINGQETALIFQFRAENFESDFNYT